MKAPRSRRLSGSRSSFEAELCYIAIQIELKYPIEPSTDAIP